MCELFALSSRIPAALSVSLEELSQHGGLTDRHKDGWGIAYYQEHDVQLIREPTAAYQSSCIQFIEDHRFASKLIVIHLRHATQGAIKLGNTQPFSRELGGRMHVFAHNGDLKNLQSIQEAQLGMCRPIGETDSEYAFCFLLALMQDIWLSRSVPSLD